MLNMIRTRLWIVLIVEMLNTAVESAINRIGTERQGVAHVLERTGRREQFGAFHDRVGEKFYFNAIGSAA